MLTIGWIRESKLEQIDTIYKLVRRLGIKDPIVEVYKDYYFIVRSNYALIYRQGELYSGNFPVSTPRIMITLSIQVFITSLYLND